MEDIRKASNPVAKVQGFQILHTGISLTGEQQDLSRYPGPEREPTLGDIGNAFIEAGKSIGEAFKTSMKSAEIGIAVQKILEERLLKQNALDIKQGTQGFSLDRPVSNETLREWALDWQSKPSKPFLPDHKNPPQKQHGPQRRAFPRMGHHR